jgi:hypothetical protein
METRIFNRPVAVLNTDIENRQHDSHHDVETLAVAAQHRRARDSNIFSVDATIQAGELIPRRSSAERRFHGSPAPTRSFDCARTGGPCVRCGTDQGRFTDHFCHGYGG